MRLNTSANICYAVCGMNIIRETMAAKNMQEGNLPAKQLLIKKGRFPK